MEKLTKASAEAAIKEIESERGSDGWAHELEDTLYLKFIECVAAELYDIDEAAEIANIIKSSKNIEFGRWFE
jgi:hypothetical protein